MCESYESQIRMDSRIQRTYSNPDSYVRIPCESGFAWDSLESHTNPDSQGIRTFANPGFAFFANPMRIQVALFFLSREKIKK